jgi:hypothetical protein
MSDVIQREKALDVWAGFFSDFLDIGEQFRAHAKNLAAKTIKGDFVLIGEYLTCTLVLENLIIHDLQNKGLTEAQLKRLRDFASKIDALDRNTHLLAKYKRFFHEIRLLRNKFAHELHYEINDQDLPLTKKWYRTKFEDSRKHKDKLKEIKSLTQWCLVTVEFGEDPRKRLTRQARFAFARRKVKYRNLLKNV